MSQCFSGENPSLDQSKWCKFSYNSNKSLFVVIYSFYEINNLYLTYAFIYNNHYFISNLSQRRLLNNC